MYDSKIDLKDRVSTFEAKAGITSPSTIDLNIPEVIQIELIESIL
jgi:hypothetical protein